ncbi:hypothetical protein WMY93_027112 [Mugilogobius chulae]|uniref:ribonuclease H n=1 Tax=Mugilogobius chulae TaxID=88201 RepID=A0AAW0MS12_9GOBI
METHRSELQPPLPVPSSENLLKFVCEFQSDSEAPAFHSEEGHPGQSVTVRLPAQCSVYQLRLRICIQVQQQQQNSPVEALSVLDPEKSTLLYLREGQWFEAYDDCQMVRTLHIPWNYDGNGGMSARILVKQVVALDSEQRLKQQQTLTYLIGHDLQNEARDRLDELTFTRPRREADSYALEPWVTTSPLSSDLQELAKRRLLVTLHYKSEISFGVKVELSSTAEELLQLCRRVLEEKNISFDRSEPLVLKVSGREEFFSGAHSLSSFLWVRHCLKSHSELHLSVLPWSCLPCDGVELLDWPPVDGFSGQFSSHQDLRLDHKDLEDIFMISLWDCDRRLRVKLLGFDVPALPDKAPALVYVEARCCTAVRSTPPSAPPGRERDDRGERERERGRERGSRRGEGGMTEGGTIAEGRGDAERERERESTERRRGVCHWAQTRRSHSAVLTDPDVNSFHRQFIQRLMSGLVNPIKIINDLLFYFVELFKPHKHQPVLFSPFILNMMCLSLIMFLLKINILVCCSFSNSCCSSRPWRLCQNVAINIKQLCQKRDVEPQDHLRLREFLQSCDLPHEFVLPFDPRVKVGSLILDKCKLMASKKKPLWLEFEPMPSPITTEPVGIIFKHGDDLRQDMLVIQTFILMDSIWQDKSLDLNLIPYGCIATGHNLGLSLSLSFPGFLRRMIETVKNAVTIASIQKNCGGGKGAFKNDALFDWLKSKCPLQEIVFNRMLQGVTNAPSTFQRLMERCMGELNLKEVLVFINDIIVFALTLEEHEERLMKVLKKLKEFGFKLSVEKCVFFQTSAKYLGHVVSQQGVKTDPDKIKTLTTWPVPTNLNELRSFLGFYCRFVQGYSVITKPLHDLTARYPSSQKKLKSKVKQETYLNAREPFGGRWSPECQQAFETIIDKPTSAKVLVFVDARKPYTLHTDEVPSAWVPCFIRSKMAKRELWITPVEASPGAKYPAHKLEFLAFKWAASEKFMDYLYGAQFTVVTDSKLLTYLLTSAKLDATSYRWLSALSTFNFKLIYRTGKQNADADGLSRRPHGELSDDFISRKEKKGLLKFALHHLQDPEYACIDQHTIRAISERHQIHSSDTTDSSHALVLSMSFHCHCSGQLCG